MGQSERVALMYTDVPVITASGSWCIAESQFSSGLCDKLEGWGGEAQEGGAIPVFNG